MNFDESNAVVIRVRIELSNDELNFSETWILDIDSAISKIDIEWLNTEVQEAFSNLIKENGGQNWEYSRDHTIISRGASNEIVEIALFVAGSIASGIVWDVVKSLGKTIYLETTDKKFSTMRVTTNKHGEEHLDFGNSDIDNPLSVYRTTKNDENAISETGGKSY